MHTDIILEADLTPSQVAELAQLAEGYGIRGVWTQNYASGRDPFLCLMPAAVATQRIMLGAVVISPYEMHPLKIANAISENSPRAIQWIHMPVPKERDDSAYPNRRADHSDCSNL